MDIDPESARRALCRRWAETRQFLGSMQCADAPLEIWQRHELIMWLSLLEAVVQRSGYEYLDETMMQRAIEECGGLSDAED